MKHKNVVMVVGLITSLFVGCANAPQTRPEQRTLEARADAVVESFVSRDPSLGEVLARSAGYAVFPEVADGAFIVGGRQSVGVCYSRFTPIGYVQLRAGSIGLQAGFQSYSQIIVFESDDALERLRAGDFDVTADASITLLQSGAGANATFDDGTAVFVDDETGLMAGASIAGQRLQFTAK